MSSTNTEAKNRRFVLIIVAIVGAIALVISGVLVWRSNNSKDSQPPNGDSNVECNREQRQEEERREKTREIPSRKG
ncbi:hypothetical protein [Bifidobacterium boum]|uniref:hypothetical protein n=1 Tax=Bifidobacterium boum TaxID=78343 RepID=UPI003F9029DF